MKKLLVISFVLVSFLVNFNLFAQGKIKQGIYKIGGSVGFSSSNNDNDYYNYTTTNIYFTPSFSYLITNGLEVGGRLGFQYYESKSEPKKSQYGSTYKSISRSYGIGPFVRYYYDAGKVFPFLGVSFNYNTNKLSGDNKSEYRTLTFSGGVEIFISSSVAVEPLVEYQMSNYGQGQDYNTISVGVGINYFIVK